MKRFIILLVAMATTLVSVDNVEAQRLFRRSSKANCCQPATTVRIVPSYRTKVVALYRVRPVITHSYPVVHSQPACYSPVCSTPVYSAPVYYPPAQPVCSQCVAAHTAYPSYATQPIYDVAATSWQSDAIPIASSDMDAPMDSVMSTETAFKPAMSYDAVREAFTGYVKTSPDVNSVCAMKTKFPAYGAVIDTLQDFEKLGYDEGSPVCFPSKHAWETRPEVKEQIISALTEGGIL